MAQPPSNKPSLRSTEVSAAKWAAAAALITACSGAIKMGYDILLAKDAPAENAAEKQPVESLASMPERAIPASVPLIAPPKFAPPAVTNIPSPFKEATLRSNGKPVRLRKGPSVKAATMRFIEPGETVRVSERIDDWWYVELESGEHGYVNAAFLSEPK